MACVCLFFTQLFMIKFRHGWRGEYKENEQNRKHSQLLGEWVSVWVVWLTHLLLFIFLFFFLNHHRHHTKSGDDNKNGFAITLSLDNFSFIFCFLFSFLSEILCNGCLVTCRCHLSVCLNSQHQILFSFSFVFSFFFVSFSICKTSFWVTNRIFAVISLTVLICVRPLLPLLPYILLRIFMSAMVGFCVVNLNNFSVVSHLCYSYTAILLLISWFRAMDAKLKLRLCWRENTVMWIISHDLINVAQIHM